MSTNHSEFSQQQAQRSIIDSLLLISAHRSEMYIAYTRITLCLLLLIRFIIINPAASAYEISIPAAMVTLVYSAAYLRSYYRNTNNPIWFWASMLFDASIVFIFLLSDVLNPWSYYQGLVYLPDTAIFIIIIFSNGFRLNKRLALIGGLINMVFAICLFYIDSQLNTHIVDYKTNHVAMWLIMFIGATFTAYISASRTRSLAIKSAYESVRLDRIRDGMKSVLASHHDAHSLLSSLYVNADLIVRKLKQSDKNSSVIAQQLRENLHTLGDCITSVKHTSDGHIIGTLDLEDIDVVKVFPQLFEQLKFSYPSLEFIVDIDPSITTLVLAGGEASLKRILVNLVQNALDGNGQVGATKLTIRLSHNFDHVLLEIKDNGPGFSSLERDKPILSSKIDGMGVGLSSIDTMVLASGGQVIIKNNSDVGANVCLQIPRRQ